MAVHGTSVNGMGRVATDFSTYGMKAEDHMHISQDFVNTGGVQNIATDCLTTQNGTPNMSVNVAAGTIYIPNSSFTENSTAQNRYWRVINDAAYNVAINANASGNPRITSIFARRNANTPNDDATNAFDFVAVDGTPAGSPVAPATPANHERIADVTVASGASSITNANITDRRRIAQARANDDGWNPFPVGSYTRGSATTFTGPTGLDFTKFLTKGDKIRYVESVTGTTKYAYVVNVTTTTVTIFCGTDYSGGIAAANNPTQLFFSKDDNAVGFPESFVTSGSNAVFTMNGKTAIIRGWTFITGNGANQRSVTPTFGYTFSGAPIVLMTPLGFYNNASAPTSITQFNSAVTFQVGENHHSTYNISTTGFAITTDVQIPANWTNQFHYGYSYVAMGPA